MPRKKVYCDCLELAENSLHTKFTLAIFTVKCRGIIMLKSWKLVAEKLSFDLFDKRSTDCDNLLMSIISVISEILTQFRKLMKTRHVTFLSQWP